ncbi:MAG: single-stranded DNA-binding protein [Planctomycetota bacterium]|nr:MAG: single-stranded DNA-binding protein [Planctomycetota bacterium]
MAGYNRIVLLGNLTRDPQLSYTPSNTPVCKFGIAVNRTFRDREGNNRDEVCYVDCTLFGRGAEVFNQYMRKGRPVLVEGRLTLGQWTTPNGEKRSKHEVVVENFTFVGGRGAAERGPEAVDVPAGGPPVDEPPPGDDIPF